MPENAQLDGVELIESFLSQYGWKYERLDDSSLVTGFRGEAKSFTLFFRVAGAWLLFSILDYVSAPPPECEGSLLRHIARSNLETVFAKLAIDDLGNVVVVADLPMVFLSYDVFVEALEAFCFFTEESIADTSKAAHDPAFVVMSSVNTLTNEEAKNVPPSE
jgi:hypothetical protein